MSGCFLQWFLFRTRGLRQLTLNESFLCTEFLILKKVRWMEDSVSNFPNHSWYPGKLSNCLTCTMIYSSHLKVSLYSILQVPTFGSQTQQCFWLENKNILLYVMGLVSFWQDGMVNCSHEYTPRRHVTNRLLTLLCLELEILAPWVSSGKFKKKEPHSHCVDKKHYPVILAKGFSATKFRLKLAWG